MEFCNLLEVTQPGSSQTCIRTSAQLPRAHSQALQPGELSVCYYGSARRNAPPSFRILDGGKGFRPTGGFFVFRPAPRSKGVSTHPQSTCRARHWLVLRRNQLPSLAVLSHLPPWFRLRPFACSFKIMSTAIFCFLHRGWVMGHFILTIARATDRSANQLLQTQGPGQVARCSESVAPGPKIPRNPKSTRGLVPGINDPLSHSAKQTLIGRARGRGLEGSS